MPHFTYAPKTGSLCQGDVLVKNDDIKGIMSDVHPHYLKDDYKYFIVLTQSCDLVRRNSKDNCKSPYITIAAVRPLDVFLKKEFIQFQKNDFEKIARIINKNSKYKCQQIIERLLNNNLVDYFYLNEDLSIGFSESCVAFLKLSIPIKSNLHYDKCLNAKCLELSDDFKAKLGWLVGQMYSRVGTKDWVPTIHPSKNLFERQIDEVLDRNFKWVDESKIKQYQKSGYSYKDEDSILKTIDTLPVENSKEIISKRIYDLSKQDKLISDDDIIDKLVKRIISDPVINTYIKI